MHSRLPLRHLSHTGWVSSHYAGGVSIEGATLISFEYAPSRDAACMYNIRSSFVDVSHAQTRNAVVFSAAVQVAPVRRCDSSHRSRNKSLDSPLI